MLFLYQNGWIGLVIVYELDGDGGVDSDCTPALGENKKALLTRLDSASITRLVPASAVDEISLAWTSEPNNPNDADWPLGDYTASINLEAQDSAQTSFLFQLHRTDSGCTSQETLGTSTSFNGVGVATFTVNLNPAAGAITDRYQMRLLGTNTSTHTDRSVTFSIDADAFIELPIDVPGEGFVHSQVVIIG